jgi:hypothetical protein
VKALLRGSQGVGACWDSVRWYGGRLLTFERAHGTSVMALNGACYPTETVLLATSISEASVRVQGPWRLLVPWLRACRSQVPLTRSALCKRPGDLWPWRVDIAATIRGLDAKLVDGVASCIVKSISGAGVTCRAEPTAHRLMCPEHTRSSIKTSKYPVIMLRTP